MKKHALLISSVVCVLSLISMVVAIFLCTGSENKKFVPPSFDTNAISGKPNVQEELKYTPLEVEENYVVYICGEMIVKNNKLDIYLTNDSQNDVWIKLRIYNDNDEIIAETGILKQGEYIKTIGFSQDVKDGENVVLKIMAYEPQTYYSDGAFTINNSVKIGG